MEHDRETACMQRLIKSPDMGEFGDPNLYKRRNPQLGEPTSPR